LLPTARLKLLYAVFWVERQSQRHHMYLANDSGLVFEFINTETYENIAFL